MWLSCLIWVILLNVRNTWLKFYDSSCERTKLRVYVYKYLDKAYAMIGLNTLSVVMLSYDSDMNEIISKF